MPAYRSEYRIGLMCETVYRALCGCADECFDRYADGLLRKVSQAMHMRRSIHASRQLFEDFATMEKLAEEAEHQWDHLHGMPK